MEPSEFLETSKTLLSIEKATECDLRSSISRAYYAIYHEIRIVFGDNIPKQLLRDNKQWPRLHLKFAKRCLINAKNDDVSDFGDTFKDLLSAREVADYYLQQKVDFKKADDFYKDVEEALDLIKTITPEVIGEAVKKYLKNPI